MAKLVSLELDYSIKVSSRIENYLSPEYVYFYINKESKLLVKDKEKVLKGQPLLINNSKTIFSTVSGQVCGLKKFKRNNIEYHYLVVENDYKEKTAKKSIRKSLKIKNENELKRLLNEYGLDIKFEKKENLLLNCIDDEPYIVNNSMYLNKNINNILETLDTLKNILKNKPVYILIKNTETDVLTKINDLLGTYPDFKLIMVPNYYLIERQENYQNYLDVTLDSIFTLNLKDFNKISEIIEKDKPQTEKFITLTGDAIKNPLVINAKIGSAVKDVLTGEIEFLDNSDDLVFYYNGLMKGNLTKLDGLIVDDQFEGLIITKNEECKSLKCIKCGLCLKYCPLNINPIEHYLDAKEIKCLNCGLCAYVCPSNINFKRITKKEDNYE